VYIAKSMSIVLIMKIKFRTFDIHPREWQEAPTRIHTHARRPGHYPRRKC